jgi:glycosyltransferase involved in cell wall biosynthesis
VLYYTSSFSLQSGATLNLLRTAKEISRRSWKRAWLAVPERDRVEVEKCAGANEIFEMIYYVKNAYKLSLRKNPFYYVRYFIDTIRAIRQLSRWLRANPVAVIHANDLLDFHAPIAAWLHGRKVIWHLRTARSIFAVWPFLWLMQKIATRVLPVSRRTAEKMLLAKNKKATVVYENPPDRALFDPEKYPASLRAAVRQSLEIAETDPVVGFVGKLVKLKGHEWFLRLGQRVVEKYPNTKLVMIGGPVTGHEKYAESIMQLAGALNLNGSLLFTGFRQDVPALISIFDVMLCTSIYDDPFPGVVLQGMAMEKPLVATRFGGVPEQIEDGVNGFLADPRDTETMAALVIKLLADPAMRHQIGAAARRDVYDKFQEDCIAINRIYDSIL